MAEKMLSLTGRKVMAMNLGRFGSCAFRTGKTITGQLLRRLTTGQVTTESRKRAACLLASWEKKKKSTLKIRVLVR